MTTLNPSVLEIEKVLSNSDISVLEKLHNEYEYYYSNFVIPEDSLGRSILKKNGFDVNVTSLIFIYNECNRIMAKKFLSLN